MTLNHIPELDLTIHEVLGGSTNDLEDLLDIHRELFPQYVYYQTYMRERAGRPPDCDPRFVEHWWLVRVHGQAAAVRFFKYVPARACGIGLAVGIRPAYRRMTFGSYRRLSEVLVAKSLEQLVADAQAGGRPNPVGMVSEIESYLLKRYHTEYGFVALPVEYYEPSFTIEAAAFVDPSDKLEFRQIHLGILPVSGEILSPDDPGMLSNIVYALLVDHYGLPESHWAVRQALSSIPRSSNIEDI